MVSTHNLTLFQPARHFHQTNWLDDRTVIEQIRKRQPKVLVVDDEAEFRDSVTELLEGVYGAVVTPAESGRKAIDLVRAGNVFNIIFLDLRMPEMNGLKTYDELRQIDVACRIVLMSAHRDGPEWRKAEKLNLDLIVKPLVPERLNSILSELYDTGPSQK